MSEIEESLKRITSHSGVMGVAVLDDAGKLARYSLPQELAEKYGEQVWLLQNIARTAVRDVDPQVRSDRALRTPTVLLSRKRPHGLASLLPRARRGRGLTSCAAAWSQNDLTYFRIDTKRFEILVAPFWGEVKYGIGGAVKDKGYTLFVLQRKPGQS